VLGALLDAGLPLADLEAALGSLMIPGYRLSADRVMRAGLAATKFRLHEEPGHAGPHQHSHPDERPHSHGDHRSLAEIVALIRTSSLGPEASERAIALFRRLAEAEAAIHQMPVDRVHLHEVGALDSIVDIVGAVFGLQWFGADRIVSSPLNVGGGMVRSAHGVFPVPAPATLRLLEGAPVYSTGIQMETVTPTGALLVTGHAREFGALPAMTVDRTGYGAGDRDLPETPNVFRVVVGHDDAESPAHRVVVLECEIDDMNPQIYGVLLDRLYAAGALEVFYTAVQMKKNRPGTLLTVVAPPDTREPLTAIVFRETTTIGLRYQELSRACLEREVVEIGTPVGPIRFKIARRDGQVLNVAPEFDDCARAAAGHALPVKQVLSLALQAYWQARRP
jgi:uncharacterized protein (TIGR00299 family) protein